MTTSARLRAFLFLIGCVSLVACGDKSKGSGANAADGGDLGAAGSGSDNVTDPTCNKPHPKDAFAADDLKAGGSKVSCYYAPPLGYCTELNDATLAGMVAAGDKGAIGCKDAIVRVDAECPRDTAIGKCTGITGFAKDQTRYYYPCNQYDASPTLMSPEHSCMQLGGTYSDIAQ